MFFPCFLWVCALDIEIPFVTSEWSLHIVSRTRLSLKFVTFRIWNLWLELCVWLQAQPVAHREWAALPSDGTKLWVEGSCTSPSRGWGIGGTELPEVILKQWHSPHCLAGQGTRGDLGTNINRKKTLFQKNNKNSELSSVTAQRKLKKKKSKSCLRFQIFLRHSKPK